MTNAPRWNRSLSTLALTCIAITMAVALSPLSAARAAWQAAAPQPAVSAKTWIGKVAAVEEYLKTAPIVRFEDVSVGVTRPRRGYFAPGGPAESMVWKALPPGRSRGFYESYKSEIAAYEIDKLLALDMVPPKVERRLDDKAGVAVMWVSPTQSFADLGGVPRPPAAQFAAWNRQIVKAKMFQNLIGDIDPNLGNWLVDPVWNLIIVDHSRALTTTKKLVHEMQRIDADLWGRMQGLTTETLTPAVGVWLDKSAVGAILSRRDAMRTQIDKLVRKSGEAAVFIR